MSDGLTVHFAIAAGMSGASVTAAVTLIALFVFGHIKGRLIGTKARRSGLQTILMAALPPEPLSSSPGSSAADVPGTCCLYLLRP
jgi:hypothetical protein